MEIIILSELVQNREYLKKVIPYLKKKYFESLEDKYIFSAIKWFSYKYKKQPTLSALSTILERKENINENTFNTILERLEEIQSFSEKNDIEWLVDSTEEFCQQKAFENALLESVEILENKGNRYSAKGLIEEALKVSFDRSLGIEFFDPDGIKDRHKLYNKKAVKYKTHIEKLNYLTDGGFEEKALHVFLAGTHVGKTMTLASLTAGFIRNGYDVLYVTLEMAEEKIAKLIDANFLDIKINEVKDISENDFISNYQKIDRNYGRLFIREFPTTTAGVSIFRALLDDLKYKKDFKPQIIVVDYINIMCCDRFKDSNSYTIIKGISEELRGLAVEGKYCIISATQTNRDGSKNSDIDMTDTAESYGLPQTVDLLIGLMTSDTLREQNLLIWKSLKNRLAGIVNYKFPVKTQFEYAKLLDCDPDHENIVQNDTKNDITAKKEQIKNKLKGLKVNNINKNDDLFN